MNEHYPKEQGYVAVWDSNFTSVPKLLFTTNEDGEPVYDFDGLVHTKFYIFKNSDVDCEEDTFDYQSYVVFAIEHLKTLIEWISKDSNLPTLVNNKYHTFLYDTLYEDHIDLNNTYSCLDILSPTGNTFLGQYGVPKSSYDKHIYITFYDKNVYKKLSPLFKKLDEVMYKKQHK